MVALVMLAAKQPIAFSVGYALPGGASPRWAMHQASCRPITWTHPAVRPSHLSSPPRLILENRPPRRRLQDPRTAPFWAPAQKNTRLGAGCFF